MDVTADEHTTAEPGLVSVIISAYNAAATIERAVGSVLAQSHQNLEVVVVDDGSTDATREILDALAKRDDRVRLLDPKPNAGVSSSRNRGLAAARGEWIAFLDADDQYLPHRLATLLAAADGDVDGLACGHTIVLPDGNRRDRGSAASGTMTGLQAAVAAFGDQITPFVWDKMFRHSALEGIRFATDVHRGEDTIFVIEALAACRDVRIIDDPLNVYYVSAGSLTWGRVPPLTESDAAAKRFEQVAVELGSQAQATWPVTKVITYLNSANLAAGRLPADQAAEFMTQARQRFSWAEARTALRQRPAVGAAGILLKAAPRLYSKVYAAYAKRSYGVG